MMLAIVQARSSSIYLPNKVMKPILERPVIEILLHRLAGATYVDKIVLATSTEPTDDLLSKFVESLGYAVVRGSREDVLDGLCQVHEAFPADNIVRIAGDCPLIDPSIVDAVIAEFRAQNVDYLSNIAPPTFPDGLGVEVFTAEALARAAETATKPSDREHVTSFILDSPQLSKGNYANGTDYSDLRWTVVYEEDLEVVSNILRHFSPRLDFSWKEILALYENQPELFSVNRRFTRNAGSQQTSGQDLWERAKKIIPGGNSLLSKRPEMFLPNRWPTYFDKSRGCKVWDLDGTEFLDFSTMSIGTNILGYSHPRVDAAVMGIIKKGTMSTLNCPEEVYLAEKLIEMHSWADMARFARTGGEANAAAVRIGRAASGKDKVAICGYHGWHDWYLAANIANDQNLDKHLLPGLESKGIPINLRDTVFPFMYNDFNALSKLVDCHDIGVIKMEVSRNSEPQDNFLNKVRELASNSGIVLIFDECTSGFRETFGGLHLKYDVQPDMAIFGKALGNGYAITSIIGREEVMESAQSTFMSSTFWTERIGPTAALAVLEVMKEFESWDYITKMGLAIRKGWQELADRNYLKISHWGLPALAGFTIDSPNSMAYKTYITQEMLKNGFLAGNSVYVSTSHTSDIISRYFEVLDPIFTDIQNFEQDSSTPDSFLNGPICHDGFKRLN